MLTAEDVKKVVSYDKNTGKFIRLTGKYAGRLGGYTNPYKGYVYLRINGKKYMAHRVAWLYEYGTWPIGDIDHINQIKDDNRIENLREVSKSENQHNVKMNKHNTSGATGVYFSKAGKWIAQVVHLGKAIYLGSFTLKEDAIAKREAANEVLQFTKLHGKSN